MGFKFTESDLGALKDETGLPVLKLKQLLASRESLSGFSVQQLKVLIRFIKSKIKVHINVTGTKDKLINNVINVIFSSSSSTSSSYSRHEDDRDDNVTIEHNVNITQPAYPIVNSTSNLRHSSSNTTFSTEPIFDDINFKNRQSPFFEVEKLFLVFPFPKHDVDFQINSFSVDTKILAELKSGTRAVHARFFSKERGADIPWNVDVRLRINHHPVDLAKLARKIRSKSITNPFILPRPADITQHVRNVNTIEFCHPGESGVLVIQYVKEKMIPELISAIIPTETTNNIHMEDDLIDLNVSPEETDEVEEVNYMLSMRCPLSYQRIEVPVKTKYCKHAQCYDLKTFLEYSHQQQLWQCPVCFLQSPYKDLIIDQRFKSILNSVSEDSMQVIIHPDGSFSLPDPPEKKKEKQIRDPNDFLEKMGVFSPEASTNNNNSSSSNNNNNNIHTNGILSTPSPPPPLPDTLFPYFSPPPLPSSSSSSSSTQNTSHDDTIVILSDDD